MVALLGGNKLESSTSDSCPGEALQLDLFCCRLMLNHAGRNGIIIFYLSVSIEMETEHVENERNITVVDLFAGCGGMSLGFEKAGVNVVLPTTIGTLLLMSIALTSNILFSKGIFPTFPYPRKLPASLRTSSSAGLLVRISRKPARDPRMVGAQSSLLDMPRLSRGASLASSLWRTSHAFERANPWKRFGPPSKRRVMA